MKKHFILSSLFALSLILNTQTQLLASTDRQSPGIGTDDFHKTAEQQSGTFSHAFGRDHRGDCDKCHNGKKSKKHGSCNQPGNHYGKHRHHNKHQNSCGTYKKNRSCGDPDRWNDRNRRDHRNDRWGNDNQSDRRGYDDRNRGYEDRDRRGYNDRDQRTTSSSRPDRNKQYRSGSRTAQRKVVSTGQSKTNRPGVARRAGSRQLASRQ